MEFQARVLSPAGSIESLSHEAADEGAARRQLEQLGMQVLSLEARDRARGFGRMARFPLLLFAQELQALLAAGLSVIEALDLLVEREQSPLTRAVLERLGESLRAGHRLSAAVAQQPDIFPALFVGILQAAEGTSDLPSALARYVDYETRLSAVRQKVISAAIYPAILALVGGGVAAFLLGYVVPRFAAVYRSGGRSLPWASQMLLDWGDFARSNAVALGLVAIVMVGSLAWWVRRHLRQGTWWRMLAVIPGASSRLQVLEVSRLYLTLGMLLQGGLPISHALALSRAVLPPARQRLMDDVVRKVSHGEALSEAFVATGFSTSVALRLLRVGERSGQLGLMLLRTADFYEGETTRWIERFTKAFEPVLMAAIGIVIGLIVILLYMPIFDLAGSLQ